MEIPRWMVSAIKHFSFTKPMLVLTLVSICLLGCKKDYLTQGFGAEFVGEWELKYIETSCTLGTSVWPDCQNQEFPSDDFKLVVKANGRISSYKNGEKIWCNRISDLRESSTGAIVVVYMKNTDEDLSSYSFFIDDNRIGSYHFPDPLNIEPVNPGFSGRVAVYVKRE